MRTRVLSMRLLAAVCLASLLGQGLAHGHALDDGALPALDALIEGDDATAALASDDAHHEHSSTRSGHSGPCRLCRSQDERETACETVTPQPILRSPPVAVSSPATPERPSLAFARCHPSRAPPILSLV